MNFPFHTPEGRLPLRYTETGFYKLYTRIQKQKNQSPRGIDDQLNCCNVAITTLTALATKLSEKTVCHTMIKVLENLNTY